LISTVFASGQLSLRIMATKGLMFPGIHKYQKFLPAAFIVLIAAVFGAAPSIAAQTKTNVRKAESTPSAAKTEEKKPADTTRYSYEFTQPEFTVRHIVIDHDATGRGKISFERKGEETAIEEPIELSTTALGRILGAWTELRFLESTENYQADRQFPHLGTMRLKMEHDSQKRTAEFNWSNNKRAWALANEYRRLADQVVLVFDIAVARESQPLNMPKLMEECELRLRLNGLSDPKQLIPLLQDISTDDHVPLIARNHALRLIKKIEK
jgi:hypothetical protein